MAKLDVKTVREKCNVMKDAWFEGAKRVSFNGLKQTDFQNDNTAADGDDAGIANLESELKMKRDVRDDKYAALNEKRSKVCQGVAGDPAYDRRPESDSQKENAVGGHDEKMSSM